MINSGHIIGTVLVIIFALFYLRNLYKALLNFKEKNFTIKTILRVIGVFIPVFGFIMGFMK